MKLMRALVLCLAATGCIHKPVKSNLDIVEVTVPKECIEKMTCGKDITCKKKPSVTFNCVNIVQRPVK